MSRVVVPGFRHEPGRHCASTSLADVARWNGLPWSEAFCFGLGAGPGFAYAELADGTPSRLIMPRHPSPELNFLGVLGLPQDWRLGGSPEEAWRAVRSEIDAGRPVLLLTDLFYLDYYKTQTHFSGHTLVLAGYDEAEGVAFTADTERPGLQQTSLASLAASRRSHYFPKAIDHHWLPGGPWQPQRPLADAVREALRIASAHMLRGTNSNTGVAGIRFWAQRVANWAKVADWSWSARFAYQVIERRGTGGAAFRRLYHEFLVEAASYVPALGTTGAIAAAAAACSEWHDIALHLRRFSLSESTPDFAVLREPILALAATEQRLFEAVAAAAEAA